MDSSGVKPPKRTIGRAAYFRWWVPSQICLATVYFAFQHQGNFGPGLFSLGIAGILFGLVIRVITSIRRLRDIGESPWLTLIGFVPIVSLMLDAFLIFKPGRRDREQGYVYVFFQMALLVMLLVTVAMLSAIFTMHFAIHGAEVQVPVLKGMTVADARSQTSGLGLNLDVDNRYYSSDIAAGHILSQSPAPGTVVRREWRVRVAESLGPQKVEVPDAVGVDERVAGMRLRRVGLDIRETVRLPWGKAPEGTVLAQDPPPHAQGIARPSINLLVAAPGDEAPDGFVMPDLSGLPLAAAQAALVKVGIKPAALRFADVPIPAVGAGFAPPAPATKPGAVIAQQPEAGTRIEQSAQVRFTVAK